MVFIFGTSALASSPGSEGVQQSVTVKGTVVDSNNDPLVGVSVFVVLHEDLQQLDEVVVVGYGVQQKSHLTGGITKVNTEGIEDMPVSRLDQALMGKAAGVQILNLTSEVGAEPDIMVRGTSSFSASSACRRRFPDG